MKYFKFTKKTINFQKKFSNIFGLNQELARGTNQQMMRDKDLKILKI